MPEAELSKAAAVSGFPEWLPHERLVEQRWIDTIRRGFERYGYAPIETAAVETLDALLSKGETSKEVYTLCIGSRRTPRTPPTPGWVCTST